MKRINPSISLGVISLGAVGAISGVMLDGALTPTGTKAFPANAYSYGSADGLNQAQSVALDERCLDFSKGQSYDAMRDRFGYPDARSSDGLTDWYQKADGAWVGVQYSSDNRATGLVGD